ncbi:type II toxin-antitoxin system ParD family antitoxin [Rhodospirillum sp. A1_3_36]|uniref:ribbon-helix-helix domain-containing protein n=1 Tax=Rhodospirillum sp. A1_3_36 TaxID=3391666 RepID=UPI0039A75618
MASDRINARLTEPLAAHVARVVGAKGLYETPSEYIRALIRQDMERQDLAHFSAALESGYRDIEAGRVFKSSGSFTEDRKIFEQKEKDGWR